MNLHPAQPVARTHAIPARFGTLLLQYCDVRADGRMGELLTLPKAVGEHLRKMLAGAGYITAAPQLGFFAGDRADGGFAVLARPQRRASMH